MSRRKERGKNKHSRAAIMCQKKMIRKRREIGTDVNIFIEILFAGKLGPIINNTLSVENGEKKELRFLLE